MTAPVAGMLRSRLRDLDPVRPESAQGPVPSHLMPRQQTVAATPAAAASPPPPPVRPPISPPATPAPLSAAPRDPAPTVQPDTSAESSEERKRRLDRANVVRSRARRRGLNVPQEPRGPRVVAPTPPCPSGCTERRPVNRGLRCDGRRRWKCRTCGCSWTVAREDSEIRRVGAPGRPKSEIQGRPDCPDCRRPAASMGTAPNGRRLWVCRDCGKRWRTLAVDAAPPAAQTSEPSTSELRSAASAMGREGGRVAAARRMETTTPAERTASARHAAAARWGSTKAAAEPPRFASPATLPALRSALAALSEERERLTTAIDALQAIMAQGEVPVGTGKEYGD